MVKRQRDLTARLDVLRSWALSQVAVLWARTDPDDIHGSWLPLYPSLIELHRALVVEALEAVDLFMLLTAADAGWRYGTTWQMDALDRPDMTGRGRRAAAEIGITPGYVLWRIKQGKPVDEAMLMGHNYLARIFGSEAHQIGRDLPLARVVANMEATGR